MPEKESKPKGNTVRVKTIKLGPNKFAHIYATKPSKDTKKKKGGSAK